MASGEMLLRRVWANRFSHTNWEEAFVIDESLPRAVIEQIAGPADIAVALNYWRDMMVEAIDEVVRRYKAGAAA